MLELRHISKSFGGVKALRDVSLQFAAGEIHGLIGENGAGKSTSIKIMTGIHSPDTGEVWLDGAQVTFADYRDASRAGIGLVSQEISVLPDASVAENIMIDKLVTRRWGVVDWRRTDEEARRHMAEVGLAVAPDRLVRGLSAAQKQLVQIAKALSGNVRVLLLDEPTSSLTEHEATRLFGLLRQLRARGVAVIFVSHKLDEVLAICDRVSVLRDGAFVGCRPVAGATPRDLVQLMLGRTTNDDHLGRLSPRWTDPVLRVEQVTRRGKCRGASFSLHRGEVLGFYGLVGSGRTELARLIIGDEPIDSGTVYVHGEPAMIRGVEDSLYRHRIGYVTENRKDEGLLLYESVETNLTLPALPRLGGSTSRRLVDHRAAAEVTNHYIAALAVKTPSRRTPVGALSGGNQQKVSIGKWLAAECDILVIDEPTVGVDVGAKQQIHQLIWELAARQGKAVIVISSDLPELVRITNRILVFREQRIVGEVRDIDREQKSYAAVSAEIAPFLA